ncbi:MAG TPA: isochorismatase family cysteine hydrolase [Bacillales bacterium]|nr:isochorismatase family cysteine hydrolase [Bacillales bacterium]
MTHALIVIDYTVDFVADEGKLTCGEPAQALDSYISRLMNGFYSGGDYVIIANDTHEQDDPFHPETKLFPPHNIKGTKGRELYGEVKTARDQLKDGDRFYEFDKTRYSAFAGTKLELYLRERGIEELHLVGVCTDICVLHTAVDAYNKGFRLVIHEGGVASFDQKGHEWALGHFENTLGAKVLKK